jgi:hypothetical protein
MDDVIEVMKLLCYEMMELQRTQQDPDAPVGQNSEIVWQLLQQQADTLVVLLTTQTGQVCQCNIVLPWNCIQAVGKQSTFNLQAGSA